METQAFIYPTLSTLTLCLICARQTPPYLTLFLLKSKIHMEKTLLSVHFIVFNNLLCEFDWNSLIYADANAAYNGFLQKYTEFYNKSFPIKF